MGDTAPRSSHSTFPSSSAASHLSQNGSASVPAAIAPQTSIQLKVSVDSKPKIVAGAIAGKLREAHSPSMDAIGATCVNHALKAIVAAREYVAEDGFDASCSVFHMDKVGPDAIRFVISRVPVPASPSPEPTSDFKVAASTRPASLAGAIANKIRDNASDAVVHVSAIGPAAVLRMIKALALAGQYLQEDGLACSVFPSFVRVTVNDEERTGLRCIVLPTPSPLAATSSD